MPKEQINYPNWRKLVFQQAGDDDPDAVVERASIDPALIVHWAPDGNVVLTVRTYPDADWADHESASCWPDSEPVEISTAFLARSEINHLIKTLRRARDSAYGRDE